MLHSARYRSKSLWNNYMQYCFINRWRRVTISHWTLFVRCMIFQLRDIFHLCLRALIRNVFEVICFIVDEKVNIPHFHDDNKSLWPSILYHNNIAKNRNMVLFNLISIIICVSPQEKDASYFLALPGKNSQTFP